jgi:hypothetical protein
MIATRPATLFPRERAPAPSERPWPLDCLPRLFLLACAGVVLQIAWLMLWTLSYRLTHGNDFTYTYLVTREAIWERLYELLLLANTLAPGIEPDPTLELLVNGVVLAFVIAGLGYLGGVLLLDSGIAATRGAMWVVLGFSLLYQATLFLLPGLFTTDIFSYLMYGHIAGIYSLNPHIYPPIAFPANPLLNWIHPIWHNASSVYGPLWTDIGWAVARLTEPLSLTDQVFAYKLLMGVVHLVNLALVWWLLGHFAPEGGSPRARITAFTVFAWNPLVLFEVVGNAHNDGLMVTLMLFGLVPLALTLERVRGRAVPNWAWLLSVVFVGLSALVKYTTGFVGLFYAVAWSRQLAGWRERIAWIGGAGVAVLSITLALSWPWLQLPEMLYPMLNAAGGNNYTNSIPDLGALTVADQVIDPAAIDRPAAQETARFWMKATTRALFLLYLAWELRRVWRVAAAGGRTAIEEVIAASVRSFLVLLLVVLTWVLTWYFTWPLALATLLGWRRTLSKVVVGYTLTSLPVFYVHHYWDWHMPGALLFLYALPPLLFPASVWLRDALRLRRIGPLDDWRIPTARPAR